MTFYLPIITGPYDSKTPGGWLRETPVSGLTRDAVIKDILDGQIENVAVILMIDPLAGTCRDVTIEIANAVCDETWGEQEEPFAALRTWLDRHADGVGYYIPDLRYGGR